MPLRLEKRPDRKTWYIRGTIAGRKIRESTGLARKSDAELFLIQREREIIEAITLGEAASYTFSDAVIAYVEAGGSPRFLARLVQHFGPDRKLRTIDNRAAHAAAEAIYPNAKWATRNRQAITPIAAVYAHAALDEIVPQRKFRKIPAPKGDGRRMRWLDPSEAERLIDAAEPHLLPTIAFLIGSGARPVEALSLERASLHIRSRQAWIADTKTGRPRMVRFPERSAAILETIDHDQARAFLTLRSAPYVIRKHRGGQISAAFRNACDRAGLGRDVTPYTLRHTWATWHSAQTGDLAELMDLGGWAKADMAMHYRKIAPDDLRDRLLSFGWDFRKETRHQARALAPVKLIEQRASRTGA